MTWSYVATVALFATAFGLAVVIEVVARRPESQMPTLGDMCGFVMSYRVGRLPVGRIAVLGFVWWAGWHFFAR